MMSLSEPADALKFSSVSVDARFIMGELDK